MGEDRFSLLVSIHILLIKEQEILLLLRKNISSDGLYGLVAGHLDAGETVTNAIIREAKEEANITINPVDIEFATTCHSYNSKNNKEFIQFYVVCKKWQGEVKNNEPEKCGDLSFFPIDNLPNNMVPYVRDGIKKVMLGTKYYEYGWHGEP